MPKEVHITAYQCRKCKRVSIDLGEAEKHERISIKRDPYLSGLIVKDEPDAREYALILPTEFLDSRHNVLYNLHRFNKKNFREITDATPLFLKESLKKLEGMFEFCGVDSRGFTSHQMRTEFLYHRSGSEAPSRPAYGELSDRELETVSSELKRKYPGRFEGIRFKNKAYPKRR